MKKYDLSFYEDIPNKIKVPADGFDTVTECLIFAKDNNIEFYFLHLTEYDLESIDEYGCPDIVLSISLQEIVNNFKEIYRK